MKPRKHNYVVGFVGENQVAYGKDRDGHADYIELLTLNQAKSGIKKLADTPRAIFKLVPVEVINGKSHEHP
jgi:hypothetical protein